MFCQYINGKLVEGKGNAFDVFNPATDEVIETLNSASAEQVQEALESAQRAFPKWSSTPINDRIALLNRFREECIREKETIAMLIHQEVGLSYPESLGEVDTIVTQLWFNSEEVRRIGGQTTPDYIDPHGEVIHIVGAISYRCYSWAYCMESSVIWCGCKASCTLCREHLHSQAFYEYAACNTLSWGACRTRWFACRYFKYYFGTE